MEISDNLIGLIAVFLIFGGGTAFLLAISPIGKAIAARIQRRGTPHDQELADLRDGQQAVLSELDSVRSELAELGERLDFAERLLAKRQEAERLPPSDSPS